MRVIKSHSLLLALLIAVILSGCKGGSSPTYPGPYAEGPGQDPVEQCVEVAGVREVRCPPE
jgi:hypothetical protein